MLCLITLLEVLSVIHVLLKARIYRQIAIAFMPRSSHHSCLTSTHAIPNADLKETTKWVVLAPLLSTRNANLPMSTNLQKFLSLHFAEMITSARVNRLITFLKRGDVDEQDPFTEDDAREFRDYVAKIVTGYHNGHSLRETGSKFCTFLRRFKSIPDRIVREVVNREAFDVLFEMSLRGRQSGEWEEIGCNSISLLLDVDGDFADFIASANWWEWVDLFMTIYTSRQCHVLSYEAIYKVFAVLIHHRRDLMLRCDPKGKVWLPEFIQLSMDEKVLQTLTARTRCAMWDMITAFLEDDVPNREWAQKLVAHIVRFVETGRDGLDLYEKQCVLRCLSVCVSMQDRVIWHDFVRSMVPFACQLMFESPLCFVFSTTLMISLKDIVEEVPSDILPQLMRYTVSLRELDCQIYGFALIMQLVERKSDLDMSDELASLMGYVMNNAADRDIDTKLTMIACATIISAKVTDGVTKAIDGRPSLVDLLKDALIDSEGEEMLVYAAMMLLSKMRLVSAAIVPPCEEMIQFLRDLTSERTCQNPAYQREWDGFIAQFKETS